MRPKDWLDFNGSRLFNALGCCIGSRSQTDHNSYSLSSCHGSISSSCGGSSHSHGMLPLLILIISVSLHCLWSSDTLFYKIQFLGNCCWCGCGSGWWSSETPSLFLLWGCGSWSGRVFCSIWSKIQVRCRFFLLLFLVFLTGQQVSKPFACFPHLFQTPSKLIRILASSNKLKESNR